MIKKTLGYLFLFFVISSGCIEKDNHGGLTVIKGYTDKYTNNKNLNIKSFRVVPLETNDSCLIKYISKIEIVDSLILVLSDERLFCFNYLGKYKYSLSNKGNGPGEYIRLNTFIVNRREKTVYLFDEYKRSILIYNLNGKYLSEKRYSKNVFSFLHDAILLDNDNLVEENYVYNNLNCVFSILNLKEGKRESLYKFPVKTKRTAEFIGMHVVSGYNGSLKLIIPFDNKIYTIKNNKLKPVYTIATTRKILPEKKIKNIDNFSSFLFLDFYNKKIYTGFKSIFETEKYILLYTSGLECFLIEKNSLLGKIYNNRINYNSRLDFLPLINILYSTNKSFIGYINSNKLKKISKNISNNTKNDYLLTIKHLADSLNFDDNPCLLEYDID